MKKPKAVIIRTAGTNCDYETKTAFELSGAQADRVHINRIIKGEIKLSDYQLLALPGGFSYGDDIASGKILANELKYKLGEEIRKFDASAKPIIGICNGFQVLVKMGLLPGNENYDQTATLTFNDSDKFESRWVFLRTVNSKPASSAGTQLSVISKGKKQTNKKSDCFWTEGLPEVIRLPVAHGEGKFVGLDKKHLDEIENSSMVVFRYCDPAGEKPQYPHNPNGSVNDIAGICNKRGNVFGLMPHPERFVYGWQSPSKMPADLDPENFAWGLKIFKNAVESVL